MWKQEDLFVQFVGGSVYLENAFVVGEEGLVGANQVEALWKTGAEHRLLSEEQVDVLLVQQKPQHLLPQRL